jgi:hypothetical protein
MALDSNRRDFLFTAIGLLTSQISAAFASPPLSQGAALLGRQAPGSDQPQAQNDKNAQVISVAASVLDADAGDHALAWKRALILANGRPVDVSGAWTFLTALDASGYDVHTVGTATIDGSAVAAAYPVTLGGTLGASAALGASVAKGAARIVSALSVHPGDLIKLVSTDLWSTERSYYYKGELARVLSASGGAIYLQGALNDSYAAATTTVSKINAKKISLDGQIEINRQGDTKGGFLIQWAKDIALNKPSTIQARERGIYVKECLGGYVADGQTVASLPVGGTTNYGLVFDSCAEIVTIRGNYHAGRHGISTGGTFPCRDMMFDRTIADNDDASGSYCCDSHGNGERFVYRNVIARNGATFQSIDTEVAGGVFSSRNQANALAFTPSRNASYLKVSGGVFDASSQANGRGITLTTAIAGLTIGEFSVTGRASITANNPIYHIPFPSGSTTVRTFKIDNCDMAVKGQSTTAGVYVGTNYPVAKHRFSVSHQQPVEMRSWQRDTVYRQHS